MFSIIAPLDPGRLEQFTNTKRAYDAMPQKKEFIIPTRNELKVARYLDDHKLMKGVKLIPYTIEVGFNVSKALNLGVKNAKYDSIIITSPEVLPVTSVLTQLEKLRGKNIVCQVWDEDEDGKVVASLVHKGFRDDNPGMYFLAMFNKNDILKINGWDEEFLKGYAYEDNDFGERWKRAGLPFSIREDIWGRHQYHPRGETISGGLQTNLNKFNQNNAEGIIVCKNGIDKLDI